MTTTLTPADAHQCLETATRFYWHLDFDRYDDIMALMTADGIWYRQGKELTPGPAMLAVLRERKPSRRVAHILSNLTVTATGPDTATVEGYLTAWAHAAETVLDGPYPLHGPDSISTIALDMQRVAGVWRVHRSHSTARFRRG